MFDILSKYRNPNPANGAPVATITLEEIARRSNSSVLKAAQTIAKAERVGLLTRVGPNSWALTIPDDAKESTR
ncbi:hypothetical protein [Nocardiopsis halotolerans]|uniref:hypothetical protein n=1 Tax=Nocardiopsis halotolerans TaxID=124252 RepID=UPI00036D5610|nr:hypothetical protein [Nocardiopsis halotolerans]